MKSTVMDMNRPFYELNIDLMKYYSFVSLLLLGLLSVACASNNNTHNKEIKINTEALPTTSVATDFNPSEIFDGKKIEKTVATWKSELTSSEYEVLREHGTERAFTGELLKNKKEGVYCCNACKLPLFTSKTKFVSGTGWPSFWDRIDKKNVAESVDNSYGMRRVEVHCGRCDGHLVVQNLQACVIV